MSRLGCSDWRTDITLDRVDHGDLSGCIGIRAHGRKLPRPVIPPFTLQRLMYQLNYARDAFRHDYLRYFESTDVDVVLCPPNPGPAPKPETSKYWTYTSLWNLLDYPAGVFPTGLAVEPSDVPDEAYEFWSEDDKRVWGDCKSLSCLFVKTCVDEIDDSPESFKDAPLALQIAGPRWEDEKVCKAIEIVSKVALA